MKLPVVPSTSGGRSPDWPKSPRLLSGLLRQLAPPLRSIAVDLEFLRDGQLRIVTVALAERGVESATDYRSVVIGQRFRACIE
jgi:hypothetical protein